VRLIPAQLTVGLDDADGMRDDSTTGIAFPDHLSAGVGNKLAVHGISPKGFAIARFAAIQRDGTEAFRRFFAHQETWRGLVNSSRCIRFQRGLVVRNRIIPLIK
jgi:hypothetical protein